MYETYLGGADYRKVLQAEDLITDTTPADETPVTPVRSVDGTTYFRQLGLGSV